jgi:hypothetical protein
MVAGNKTRFSPAKRSNGLLTFESLIRGCEITFRPGFLASGTKHDRRLENQLHRQLASFDLALLKIITRVSVRNTNALRHVKP